MKTDQRRMTRLYLQDFYTLSRATCLADFTAVFNEVSGMCIFSQGWLYIINFAAMHVFIIQIERS